MTVFLRPDALSPWVELDRYAARPEWTGAYGATAVFVGTMRDLNLGRSVSAMTLEYYPGMTERELERIEAETRARWDVLDTLTVHRVGTIAVHAPIVLVAVWAVHRGEAFDACRYIMEALKSRAPFWKQEVTSVGAQWVHAHAPGADPVKG